MLFRSGRWLHCSHCLLTFQADLNSAFMNQETQELTGRYTKSTLLWFYVDYIPDIKPIGLPESRHEGRMRGKGTLGRKSLICMDGHSRTEAHYTVLQNSTYVAPYIQKHMDIVCSKNPGMPDFWIRRKHMKNFGGWLQAHIVRNNTSHELHLLSMSPASTVWTYQGYEINGNTFYTIAQIGRASCRERVSSPV